jgi:hypothetical protein
MTRLEFWHFATEECQIPAHEAEVLWARRPSGFEHMGTELLRIMLLCLDGPTQEYHPVTGAKIHPTSPTPLPVLARKMGGRFDIEV